MPENIKETAVAGSTGAHSVAVRTDRLGGMQSRMSLKDFMVKFHSGLTNRYKFHRVDSQLESATTGSITESMKFPYQVDDATSRLKSMETDGTYEESDSVTYGIEDDQGVMMKVTVPMQQGEDFERHIAQSLADVVEYKKTGRGEDKSLAELLYELKDQFTVISAEFPTVPKDAVYNADEITEDLPEVDNDDLGDVDDLDALGDESEAGDNEFDPEDEELGDDFDAPGDSKEDLLNSVLGMLKSQNEKEVAQANAAAEEAKARQAELALQSSRKEMETQEDAVAAEAEMEAEKDKEKKAKEMAELAKFNYKKKMGESVENSGFSPLFRSTLLELDSNDTVQSLRRQMSTIGIKYRAEPTDDMDTQRFKRTQQQAAMRELRIKMQAARNREDYEANQAEKDQEQQQDQEDQDSQDPQASQQRTNDRGQ